MPKQTYINAGTTGAPSGVPFNLQEPYVVYSASILGSGGNDRAADFSFAASLARNYAEYNDEGFQTEHIQIWDQHGRLAVDMRRANETTFKVIYHPDLAYRFN